MSYLGDEIRSLPATGRDSANLRDARAVDVDFLVERAIALEDRLQLVKDLALTARNAAPEGREPYWVSPILQAIGES